MRLPLLSLLVLSSCGYLSYGTMYRADTTKQFECGQMTQFTEELALGLNPDADLKVKLEKEAGFRSCVYSKPSEDSLLMECTEPKVYKSLFTKKSAECVAFKKTI
jgi:hypothetical protein